MELFRNDEIDAVYLIYNEFKSVVDAEADRGARAAGRAAASRPRPVDYIFEQPPAEMLDDLLPQVRGNGVLPRAARIGGQPSMPRA